VFQGVAAGNGYGDPIDASRAGRIARAFRAPLSYARVHTAGFSDDAGFCQRCGAPYCSRHWHLTESASQAVRTRTSTALPAQKRATAGNPPDTRAC
jgi:hypothetical protein